jgi:hypothetical protein
LPEGVDKRPGAGGKGHWFMIIKLGGFGHPEKKNVMGAPDFLTYGVFLR